MVPPVLTRKQVRAVDRIAIEEFGLPGIVLMENAASGCVRLLQEREANGPIVICAGKGNNGGDGFAMARLLDNAGFAVTVLLFADPESLTGDAATNFNVAARAGLRILPCSGKCDEETLTREVGSATWIVDALLGTGMQGAVRDPFRAVIRAMNASQARVLAVDVPSGIDCDSGVPVDESESGCVRADLTATFVARKSGFENPRSADFTGDVHVVDIGVPHSLFEEFAEMFLPAS